MSKEQEKTAAELQERERIARELEEEKKKLEDVTSDLKGNLTVSYIHPYILTSLEGNTTLSPFE